MGLVSVGREERLRCSGILNQMLAWRWYCPVVLVKMLVSNIFGPIPAALAAAVHLALA